MTAQDGIVARLKTVRVWLAEEIGELQVAATDAEGGNLAEVYEGARDWLLSADESVKAALLALAPEEES